MALILAIDEDVVLTMSLDLQLGNVGHIVRRANSFALATQFLEEQQPTVIVIDPSFEVHAGWQIIEQWASKIPVIVMSDDPTAATADRAKSLGTQGLIAKPFLMNDLVEFLTPFIQTTTTPAIEKSIVSDVEPKPKRNSRKKNQSTESRIPVPVIMPSRDTLGLSITDADELLLTGLPTTVTPANEPQLKKESMGSRLRAERTKRNIPLTQIDLSIGVHMTYVQAMEEDRFSHLPRGRMAEEMITKYVRYLGMNVQSAIDEYRGFHYSEAIEPITAFGADKLQFNSYRRYIFIGLAMIMLIGILYGVYRFESTRINAVSGGVLSLIFRETATLTPTSTITPSPTATLTPTLTQTVTASMTITRTLTATNTVTRTPTNKRRP